MKRFFFFIFLLGIGADATAEDKFSEGDALFTLKIAPLFSEKCHGCHGDDREKIKGGYDMLTREALLAGGDEFGKETVVPGDAAKSFLVEAVKWADPDWEMPPKENDRLTAEQIADVEKWINAGAPWPDEKLQAAIREAESKKLVTADGVIVETSGGLGDEWTFRRYQPEEIWAFQPVTKPAVPAKGNPVDAFVKTRLSEAGFQLGPEAEPRALLRRASYDLIGLPPTPEETAAFLKAWKIDSEKAWSAEIDRLLASPHYGERWAQHWLDVARYADTGGLSNDYERSNAWRYRDYVIRSFNADKPYNRFIIEQLAGDELADQSLRKRMDGDFKKTGAARKNGDYTQEEAEWLVATGFLRMGPWDDAMVKKPEARQLYLDDVVNSVGQTFLATTMRCFKCHDHKFDPLPTKDYYRMYAAFSATRHAERPVPFLDIENRDGFEVGKAHVQKMWEYANLEQYNIQTKQENAAKKWYKENGLEYKNEGDRKKDPVDKKPPRHVGLSIVEQGQKKVREQDKWVWNRRKERYQPMAQAVFNSAVPEKGNARSLRMGEVKLSGEVPSFILTGGALEAEGDPVKPGVISALGVPVNAKAEDPFLLTEAIEGRRLGLARWVAHPKNQLTTRAIVNRIWQYHFGEAIARDPNNFGVKGRKPTHPKLLDWLAADFVEGGWKMKRLHKLIMTSQAYCVGTKHPDLEKLRAVDAENQLLAYRAPRRMSAEEMRDTFLATTGELNLEMGGLPISPEINMEVALQPRMIQFSLAPAYQPSRTPEERNRRTIYAYRVRGMADPMLELFNQPNPNDSCADRDSAAVSPQAFTLLNSNVVTDRSIALAKRLRKKSEDSKSQIAAAFEMVLGREASEGELSRLVKYVDEMRDYHKKVSPSENTYPTQITRTLVEEFSGEEFDYEEILPVFENYTSDTKASDVDAETRALADLAVLLYNSNEFIYIY